MICPVCGGQTRVRDSRSAEDETLRQRECRECGHRFATIEVDLDQYERMAPPDREKLRASVDRFLASLKAAIYKALKL